MTAVEDMTDERVVACTIYGEARGEGLQGMEAVGQAIMNRAKARKPDGSPRSWGGDPRSVCLKPYAFSCWLQSDPNRKKLLEVTEATPAFRVATQVAKRALAGDLPNLIDNCTFYYVEGSPEPAWAKGVPPHKKIGHHLFFNRTRRKDGTVAAA